MFQCDTGTERDTFRENEMRLDTATIQQALRGAA